MESPDIATLTLVTPLPIAARIYIGPWLVLYPLAAYAYYGAYDTYIKSIGELLRPEGRAEGVLTWMSASILCARSFRMVLLIVHRSLRWTCSELLGNEVEY